MFPGCYQNWSNYIISSQRKILLSLLYNKVVLEVKNIHREVVEVLGLFDNKLVVWLSPWRVVGRSRGWRGKGSAWRLGELLIRKQKGGQTEEEQVNLSHPWRRHPQPKRHLPERQSGNMETLNLNFLLLLTCQQYYF